MGEKIGKRKAAGKTMENSVYIEGGKTEELNDNCLIFVKYIRPQTLKIIHRTESLLSRILCITIMPQIVCNTYDNSCKNIRNGYTYHDLNQATNTFTFIAIKEILSRIRKK